MNTEDTPAVQSDRRQYVRVHDAVGLEIQKLNEMPAAGQVVTPKPRKTVRKNDKYEIEGYATVRMSSKSELGNCCWTVMKANERRLPIKSVYPQAAYTLPIRCYCAQANSLVLH